MAKDRKKSNNQGTRSGKASSERAANVQKEMDRRQRKARIKDEIIAVILLAIGAFLIIALQTTAAGSVGAWLSDLFKGLFGFAAFFLPYYFILYGGLLFAKKTIHVGVKSVILLVLIFLMISLINSGRFMAPIVSGGGFKSASEHYLNGMMLDDGGLFGMAAGSVIVDLIGLPGLYIFAFVIIFICLLLLMNTPVSRFFENIKLRKHQRALDKEERRKEKLREEELRQQEMEMKLLTEDHQPALPGKMSQNQRKVMDYMNDDMAEKPLRRRRRNHEPIDFSLGEDAEKAAARERDVQTALPDLDINSYDSPGADAFAEEAAAEESVVLPEEVTPRRRRRVKASDKTGEFKPPLAVGATESGEEAGTYDDYVFPSVELLNRPKNNQENKAGNDRILREKAKKLEDTLRSFNIDAQVTNVAQGPAVTRFEVHPNSGVKVKGIKNLADDIALNMEAKSIRIEAPIPGKPAVGIEIENDSINMVTIREIIDSDAFRMSSSKITFAVGKDIAGSAVVADLKTMPHLLIAGSTGSGKSVCINSIITSILYKARPDEVKFVLIDPKVVELSNYNGIPHLLIPVVTEPAKAAAALNWAVAEMDDRYRKFAENHSRELKSYNDSMRRNGEEDKVMPQIVIIIDELADLMMAAPSQVEESICRLAQKARAAGMHLIVATQRPSVDVITGVIKANIPSRIAFAVSSQFDSRTILDMSGAEKLVGKGDMLFNPLGTGKPVRVQGTFISDDEVTRVIDHLSALNTEAEYSSEVMDSIEKVNSGVSYGTGDSEDDELLSEAIELVVKHRQASVSALQRRFRIGYNRAARLMEELEERQIVGPADGSRPRQVLVTEEELFAADTDEEDLDI